MRIPINGLKLASSWPPLPVTASYLPQTCTAAVVGLSRAGLSRSPALAVRAIKEAAENITAHACTQLYTPVHNCTQLLTTSTRCCQRSLLSSFRDSGPQEDYSGPAIIIRATRNVIRAIRNMACKPYFVSRTRTENISWAPGTVPEGPERKGRRGRPCRRPGRPRCPSSARPTWSRSAARGPARGGDLTHDCCGVFVNSSTRISYTNPAHTTNLRDCHTFPNQAVNLACVCSKK